MKSLFGPLVLLVLATGLTACGGSGSTTTELPPQQPVAATDCDPADQCGTVYLALTDADGDFLNYTVDVTSLTLETANGRIVETLPRTTRIDFTEYVDLTELFTAATVPPAVYVGGTITLDYAAADVDVEEDGAARDAIVVDDTGEPLGEETLRVTLSDRDQLVVTRGRPAFLQLDFDLEASHAIDLSVEPATATAESFIIAEVSPVDEKTIRVRGPVTRVDVEGLQYAVAIRPFRDRNGDFGPVIVNVTEGTDIEVDEVAYTGSAGLEALEAAGAGTPSVALGTVDLEERTFTADLVLAGSSVPGAGRDGVVGNIIARDGNFLTVRGATLLPSDREAFFRDDVVVEVSDATRVVKDGDRQADVSIADLSIGQRVTILGNVPDTMMSADAPEILFDATEGAVRMHLTSLSGIVRDVVPGETIIDLQSIDRRRVSIFDFAGTAAVPADDADPENYQVDTGDLRLADFASGKPIVARGFPTAFGTAPPDFTGRTVIDYADVRSKLGVGWGKAGTSAPFLSIGTDGIVIDNQNPAIDQRRFIKQGPVLIDLTELPSGTSIVPPSNGRTVYVIKTRDSLRLYSDFADFVRDLTRSLDGATPARSMHAHGSYDVETNVFTARKIGIYLLANDPPSN